MESFVACNIKAKTNIIRPAKKRGTIKMKPHQQKVFDEYKEYRYVSVEQPPGSGKSALTQFIFADELDNNPDAKVVISVPQSIIVPNYTKCVRMTYSDGREITWEVKPKYNLCSANNKHVVKNIISFINHKPEGSNLSDRIMICTHKGLAAAYKRCPNLDFTNTYLIVDESHHCMIAEDDKQDYEISNGLGKLVKHHIIQNTSGSGLWLTTATFFRGDCLSVLSDNIMEMFETAFMPLDEHFKNLNIESYSYDFVPYTGEYPREEIQREFKGKSHKTILYIPEAGRLWGGNDKQKTVRNLESIIRKEKPTARILDLVNCDESPLKGNLNKGNREDRKMYLMENPSKVDVVLAVRILDEGTDWVFAQKILDMAPSESLRISCQRFGRLLRDAPNKKHIYYKVFFPFNYNVGNVEVSRESLDKYFTMKSLAFIQYDSIIPVKTICPPAIVSPSKNNTEQPEEGDGDSGQNQINSEENNNQHHKDSDHPADDGIQSGEQCGRCQRRSSRQYFLETVPDINKRADIYSEIQTRMSILAAKKERSGEKISAEEGRDCIYKALNKRRIKKNQNEIVGEIERQLYRASFPTFKATSSFRADAIHWQKIAQDTVGIFTSNKQEGQTWDKLRKVLAINHKSEKEHLTLMQEEGIYTDRQWRSYHKKNNLLEKGYYYYPSQAFKKSDADFYNQLRGTKKTDNDSLSLMKAKGIKSCLEWWKYYEDHNLRKAGHRKNPWISMGISQKEFFDDLSDRKSNNTEQEHLDLMKKADLLDQPTWWKYYDRYNLKKDMYYRCPWTVFKKSTKDFFAPIRNTKTDTDHINLIKKERLFNPKAWIAYYEKHHLSDEGYWKKPWLVAKTNATTYFAPFQTKTNTEKQHLDLIKKNKLLSAGKWIEYYNNKKLKSKGYHRTPWAKFNKTVNEFFATIR